MNLSPHDRIVAECLALLQRNNVALEDTVREVIKLFLTMEGHFSAADIQRLAAERRLKVTRSDVERALRLLVSYGFAGRRTFPDGLERFEHIHIGRHHDHLYCLKCGKIIEFFSPALEEEQTRVARKHGFHAFAHAMQIHGLCERCFGGESERVIPLSAVRAGGKFRVVEVGAMMPGGGRGKGVRRRLMEMGLAPGMTGEVLQNGPGVAVLLVGEARLALRGGERNAIRVALLN